MSTKPSDATDGGTVTIAPPTRANEIAIRDAVDAFTVVSGGANEGAALHLAGPDGDPRCGGRTTQHIADRKFVRKDTAVYPLGYRDLCKHCVELWRSLPVVAGGEADG